MWRGGLIGVAQLFYFDDLILIYVLCQCFNTNLISS